MDDIEKSRPRQSEGAAMPVISSRDLKETLRDHQIVTAEELRECLRYRPSPSRQRMVSWNTPCGVMGP
jgi:hypothetical protein